MSTRIFHPSLECAQHGGKSLEELLVFAKTSGAAGIQPSNFSLEGDGGFRPAADIKAAFENEGMLIDGISAHCPMWVHTTAWTGSKSIKPFLPEEIASKSVEEIEKWSEDYLLRLLDLAAELEVKIVPMFWGVAFGWEVATGYPWGFWAGPGFDLIAEGKERFVKKTAGLRKRANELGIKLAHEIHPGTGAMTADDFLALVDACDGDECLTVNADPSHCWEGESWETRFRKVGDRVFGCHVKNFVVRQGFPLRSMAAEWPDRAMQFVDLPSGDLNMLRYVECMMDIGYPQRYCNLMNRSTAPLIVEAESAYRDLDACSANGIAYTKDELCFPIAKSSFEDGMGA